MSHRLKGEMPARSLRCLIDPYVWHDPWDVLAWRQMAQAKPVLRIKTKRGYTDVRIDDCVYHVLRRMGTALPTATRVELIRTALRKRGYEPFSEAPIGEQYELALTVERELLG
jgi:hypothetical protein